MRHYISILTIAVALGLFCSCELETSGNGDLDGMWRLASVDTLATGGSKDMDGTKIYWSFQHKLLQLDDKAGGHGSVLLRFEHKDGALRLYDPYFYDRDEGDKPLDDIEPLVPFGVNALEENCEVEALSGSKMTLKTATLRLGFRKL